MVRLDSPGWFIALEQRGTGTAVSVGAYMIIWIFSPLPVAELLLETLLELNRSSDLFHRAARQAPLTPVLTCAASPVAADSVVTCAQRESEETRAMTYVSQASGALSKAPVLR